jgi:hypothetical protein
MRDKASSRLRLLLGDSAAGEREAMGRFAIAGNREREAAGDLRRSSAAMARHDEQSRLALAEGPAIAPSELDYCRKCAAELGASLPAKRLELAAARRELHSRREELVLRVKRRKGLEEALRRRESEASAATERRLAAEADHDHAARLAWRMENA